MNDRIFLKNGEYTLIDPEWYEYLSKWTWIKSRTGYAIRKTNAKNKRREITMGRVIVGLYDDDPRYLVCDHVNGDKLDNRFENLRICTHQENIMNQKISKNNTSGYKGVYLFKQRKKWRAMISKGKDRKHIGLFNNKIDAALAYDYTAVKYFGEFAWLNFPQMRGWYQINT